MPVRKKNKVIILLAVLVIVRMVVVFFENKKSSHEVEVSKGPLDFVGSTIKHSLDPNDATLAKTPAEAVTIRHSDEARCGPLYDQYKNLEAVKKSFKPSVRFVNIHKKIDGAVYRTRFFYKDSNENEIPTYLLYKEDHNEEDVMIENSPYKKGPHYQKIEKAEGDVLYTEEGLTLGSSEGLFLHYENKELKDLQGLNPQDETAGFIECRF